MIDEEEGDLALLSLTSSLAVTSPPLVDRMRVADLPLFLKESKIARRLATSSPIFTSDSEEKRVCEELTTESRRTFNSFKSSTLRVESGSFLELEIEPEADYTTPPLWVDRFYGP